MPCPKPTHPIHLTAAEAEQLRRLLRAHTTAQVLVVRAQIVLATHDHPAWNNQQLARALGTRDRMVRTWRQRWRTTHALADAPRSGAPRRVSP